jgi:uncharacterized phage protein gp47/JayE
MAFRTLDFVSIVAGMVNQAKSTTKKITDFTIGSVARTIFEAAAIEIDELYQNMVRALADAIPTALYLAFGFSRLPALPATGRVTFSIGSPEPHDTVIPTNTLVSTATGDKTYFTLSSAVILAGLTTVDASVTAVVPGVSGNAGAEDINTVIGGPLNLSVTNPAAITSGRDPETDSERRARFNDFIRALSRGTLDAVEFGAKTAAIVDTNGVIIERVIAVQVIELYTIDASAPLGYADLYIYNGGAGASNELVETTQRVLDGFIDGGRKVPGWAAAGVVVRVFPVTLDVVDATLTLLVEGGELSEAQEGALNAALAAYIDSVAIGGVVYLSELVAAALSVEGIIDAVIDTPATNVILGLGAKAAAGEFTYT